MNVGLETYNADGSVSLSANGANGVFTEKYNIPAGQTVQVPFLIPGIYQRWLAGRTIVLRISSAGAFSLDPASDDTVTIYTGNVQRLYVMEW